MQIFQRTSAWRGGAHDDVIRSIRPATAHAAVRDALIVWVRRVVVVGRAEVGNGLIAWLSAKIVS